MSQIFFLGSDFTSNNSNFKNIVSSIKFRSRLILILQLDFSKITLDITNE